MISMFIISRIILDFHSIAFSTQNADLPLELIDLPNRNSTYTTSKTTAPTQFAKAAVHRYTIWPSTICEISIALN